MKGIIYLRLTTQTHSQYKRKLMFQSKNNYTILELYLFTIAQSPKSNQELYIQASDRRPPKPPLKITWFLL